MAITKELSYEQTDEEDSSGNPPEFTRGRGGRLDRSRADAARRGVHCRHQLQGLPGDFSAGLHGRADGSSSLI